MNLITVDRNKLWLKNKKNLLLGNWCIDNANRYKKDKTKKYLVSKYHWNSKSKFRKDLKYLHKIYNCLLDNLYLSLNKFHNLKYPKRYWEILLYKWLWVYLFATFDRWEIIRSIKNKNKNLSTKIFDYEIKSFVPDDSVEFAKSMIFSNDWNHWIYTEIIKFIGGINYSAVNKNKIQPKFLYKKGGYKSFNYLINSISVLSREKKIYFQNTYFSKKFEIIHNLLNRQFVYSHEIPIKNLHIPLNMEARHNFVKLSKKMDKFTIFANSLIKYQLPKIYFEYYKQTKESIEKSKVPKNPKIIITSLDHVYNDVFKLYSAQKVLNGSKLFIIQHGGCYGISDFNLDEKNEIKISDKFLTWGWKQDYKKTLPLFLQKTVYKKINKKRNASGLIIPVMEGNLLPGIDFAQGSPRNKMEVDKSIDNIVSFVSEVNQSILNASIFKHIKHYKWNYTLESLKSKFPNFKFISSKKVPAQFQIVLS